MALEKGWDFVAEKYGWDVKDKQTQQLLAMLKKQQAEMEKRFHRNVLLAGIGGLVFGGLTAWAIMR